MFEQIRFEKIQERLGFFLAYIIFTTILFFILTLTDKIPASWNYINILGITLFLTILGIFLKKVLK